MRLPSQGVVMVAGVVLAITAAAWAIRKISDMNAKDTARGVAEGVVGAAAGAVTGALAATSDALGIPTTSQVIDGFNDPNINPLQGIGAKIGGTIYDWLH